MLARSLQNNKAVGLGAAALVGGVLVYLLWTYTTSSSAPPPPPSKKPLKAPATLHPTDTAEQEIEQEKPASENQDRHSIDRRRTSIEQSTPAQEPEHHEQLNEQLTEAAHSGQTDQLDDHEPSEHPEPLATPAISVSADNEADHEVPEPAILKTEEHRSQEPEQPEQPKETEHSAQVAPEEREQSEQPEFESIQKTSVSADTEIDTAVLEPATLDSETRASLESEQTDEHEQPEEPKQLEETEQPEEPEQPEQMEQLEQPEPELTATISVTPDNKVDIEVPEPAIIKSTDTAPNSGHKWADLINEVEQIALTKTQEPSPLPAKVIEQEITDTEGITTALPAATVPTLDHHVVKAEIPNPVAVPLSSNGSLDTTTNGASLEPSIHNNAARRELNTNAAVFTPSWLLKPSPAPTQTSGTNSATKQGSPAASHDSANGKSKPPRCRFWPKCTNKSCKFTHPTLPCRDPDNCTFGDRCLFVHPKDLNKRKEVRRPARGNPAATAGTTTTTTTTTTQ
ncbi:unnamed protein product [Mortierella alpina]